MDQSIRSTRGLGSLMGVAPLVTIPYIKTPAETLANRPQRKLYFILGGGLLLGVIFFTLVHFYYKPLDVLWFVVLRKLGIG
jgi:succinoglycan biosynthesis transport protein ExoP